MDRLDGLDRWIRQMDKSSSTRLIVNGFLRLLHVVACFAAVASTSLEKPLFEFTLVLTNRDIHTRVARFTESSYRVILPHLCKVRYANATSP